MSRRASPEVPAAVGTPSAHVATATFHGQVATPEPFTFSRPEEWSKWIRRFERFRIASGLASREDDVQVNTLIYAMGDQADDVLRSFALSDVDRRNYDTVKEKFDGYFIRRRNVIYERAKFNRRKQEEGETVEAFVTALYALAEFCGYGDLHNEMIRDRIVVGIRNSTLSEKLQLDSRLTLESAIAQVRHSEAVKQQQSLLRGKPDTPVVAVHKIRGGTSPAKFNQGLFEGRSTTSHRQNRQHRARDSCNRCGKCPGHDPAVCPAKDKICNFCHKRGHFRAVCRSAARVQ